MEIQKNAESGQITIPHSKEYMKYVPDVISIGDYFMSRNSLIRVCDIVKYEHESEDRIYYDMIDISDLSVTVSRIGSDCVSAFAGKLYIPDIHEYKEKAEKMLSGEYTFDDETVENETSIACTSSKNALVSMYGNVECQKRELEILHNMASSIIERKMEALRDITRKMYKQVDVYKKEMARIMKVICVIELYAGIDEEVFQLQEGDAPDIDTPLSLRQQVIYADEELGNYDDGGIDFSQLQLFDEWLIKDRNYEKIIPEIRGIVALKPRRFEKEYGDTFVNSIMNVWNKQTYFLMRNGENIYRICSPNISVSDTMFPLKQEAKNILSEPKEKQDKFAEKHMQFVAFIQGLIDRTTIFAPIANIRMSDLDNNSIELVYDAEPALSDGRKSYLDWKNEINSSILVGSRIAILPTMNGYGDNQYYRHSGEGFFKVYNNRFSTPSIPQPGVYTLEGYSDYYVESLGFLYMPEKNMYGDKPSKRSSWIVDVKYSNLLNYDKISLDDVEFYLNNRSDRKNYLNMLPLLRLVRTKLKEEMMLENEFKKYMAANISREVNLLTSVDLFDKIDEAINWWKYKNQIKRPITQDDVKASRMIYKRLLRSYKSVR